MTGKPVLESGAGLTRFFDPRLSSLCSHQGQEFRGLLEITAVEVYDDPAARDQIITLQYETEKAPSMAQGDDITVDGTIYQIRDVPADEFGTTTATLVRKI